MFIKSTLKETIESMIEKQEQKIIDAKSKMDESFQHSFEWGYPAIIYEANHKLRHYEYVLKFLNQGQDAQFFISYLKENIASIERELLDGSFSQNSSNVYSNLAYSIKKEAVCDIRKIYMEILTALESDKPLPVL